MRVEGWLDSLVVSNSSQMSQRTVVPEALHWLYALLNATLFPHYNAFRNDLVSICGTCPALGPRWIRHDPSMNILYDLGILPVSY